MAKVKVTYEREKCVGAGACEVVDPDHFKVVEDGKANLLNDDPAPVEKDGVWTLEVDESQFQKLSEAAQACPAQVIKVEKIE